MNINSYFYTMDILTFLINSTTGTRPLLSTLVSLDQDNYQILMLVITLTNYTRILQEMHLLYILVHCLRDPAIAYQGDDQHQNLAISGDYHILIVGLIPVVRLIRNVNIHGII